MGLSKCKGCNEKFSTEDMVTVSKQKFCVPCAENRKKEIEDLKTLKDFIWEQQGKDQNLMVQASVNIKRFKEEYDYSYVGILMTTQYCMKYKGLNIKDGIGIIPYYYVEARDFYRERHMITKHGLEHGETELKKKVVKVKKSEGHKPKMSLVTMDMSELEV